MSKSTESRQLWINDLALGLREEFGLAPQEAHLRASSLMDRMCEVRPADMYYWPARDKTERDLRILSEFNGRNLGEVSRKHRVSKSTVYSIRSKAMQKRCK